MKKMIERTCPKCQEAMELRQMKNDGPTYPEGYYQFLYCPVCKIVDGDYALLSVPWKNTEFMPRDVRILRIIFYPGC
ncbi:MAG: hypothetical protein HZA37_00680 [Parcubacteria group bacterium]|nr:hypothetical protein [Parcubacteria group bacterium]